MMSKICASVRSSLTMGDNSGACTHWPGMTRTLQATTTRGVQGSDSNHMTWSLSIGMMKGVEATVEETQSQRAVLSLRFC